MSDEQPEATSDFARAPIHERAVSALRPHRDGETVPAMSSRDLAGLVDDIRRRGILVPLDVTPEDDVLDGRARLRAAIELDLEVVPVRVVAPTAPLEYMILAALRRRDLEASQRAALAIELAEVREAAEQARERQRANLRRGKRSPEVASLPPRGEKTREQIAQIARVSERTAQDALTVYGSDRALFERVKTGEIRAEPAARQVRRRHRDAVLPGSAPLPEGPFELIYAGPPWQLGNPDGPFAPENHYPTLALEEIAALKVPAAEDAVLFLWTVNCLLPQALAVMEAWEFAYKTNVVWVKPAIKLGVWARNQHELLLVGRRRKYPPPEPEDRFTSVIEAPTGRHSEKPACVYELIERAYPHASKVELFARGRPRPGWVAWGNEVEEPDAEEAS